MRIGVFGAGAIGGFIAAALARSGVEVCVVARGPHLESIKRDGLRLSSDLGDFTAHVQASDDLRDFEALDYVLITFKSQQWNGVLPQFERAVGEDAVFVTLQNGLPFWYSRERALESVDPGGRILHALPYDRIIGGVVHASGHIVRPGYIRQSGGMLYPLGELDGAATPRIEHLSQAFRRAGLTAPVEPDIRRIIWRKLVNNLALNPVSALTRATVQTMLNDPPVRALLRAIIEEGLAIARASGVDPGVDADERLKWAQHIADVKTSMLQDLEARRPLELEPIAGAALELARRFDVAVPHTETVYGLTKLLERNALVD
ncbi:MAG TPA: 2-dehydropantoate 2-reductase [Candidatus Baltobacteraceae bacterium]|nr:2-dehydropantoate 2-reductase [Candidatus Baltobacteraceae bacterium]